jgi:cysteinyl-tRNA synthetase
LREIDIFNTLTGQKSRLVPLEAGHVRMYACGITVYDECHIGHAMQAIYFDVIRNYLEYAGYKVTYVRNYTDVDDKIINRARTLGIEPLALSKRIIASTQEDMKNLGVRPASWEPMVSESIPEIIDMVKALVAKGHAYQTAAGDVYFRVRSKNDYGKLSNRKPDELRSGTRDLVAGDKEDDLDFALWKKDDTEGASWDSPWGRGRPGWHIECSAMSKKYLGSTLDIHGGGRDLVFPHHENEIAQSECCNGQIYANYWIHSGLLTIDKQKMSKSLGNQITIKDFLGKWPAEVLRLSYLLQHYASNTDFSMNVFKNTARRLLYYYETLDALDKAAAGAKDDADVIPGHNPHLIADDFHQHMSDDFNTVAALGMLNNYFAKANDVLKLKKSPAMAQTARLYAASFRGVFNVLGMLKEQPEAFINQLKDRLLTELAVTKDEVENAIQARRDARANKDYATSDKIRDELLAKGVVLKDTPAGTQWTIDFDALKPQI